jgi:hypothetical protein
VYIIPDSNEIVLRDLADGFLGIGNPSPELWKAAAKAAERDIDRGRFEAHWVIFQYFTTDLVLSRINIPDETKQGLRETFRERWRKRARTYLHKPLEVLDSRGQTYVQAIPGPANTLPQRMARAFSELLGDESLYLFAMSFFMSLYQSGMEYFMKMSRLFVKVDDQ